MSAKITEAKTADERTACSNCLVTAESFASLRSDVSEILVCLKGHEDLGHRGLVLRTEANEANIASLEAEAAQAKATVRTVGLISVALASMISLAANVWHKLK